MRNFLRKFGSSAQGMARVEAGGLSPGEYQLCLLLVAKAMAAQVQEDGKTWFLLDQQIHEHMVESLANKGLSLRAQSPRAAV